MGRHYYQRGILNIAAFRILADIMPQEVLNRPSSLDQARGFDFVGLHNIAKHIIHLIESATALVCSAKSIHSHSIGMLIPVDAAASQQTSTEIEYQMALLNSVNVRLRSLATRTEAVVNLVSEDCPFQVTEVLFCFFTDTL
jgi:hypothetical protein